MQKQYLKHAKVICGLGDMFVKMFRSRMEEVEDSLEKVGSTGHEQVTKSSEVSAIVHLLGENIGGVAFAADVCNGDTPVLTHSRVGFYVQCGNSCSWSSYGTISCMCCCHCKVK